MRRYWLLLFFYIVSVNGNTQYTVFDVFNDDCINALQKITQKYYKVQPYKKDFSSFLTQLIADPDLQHKTLKRRTDSTFFFLSGDYRTFNPVLYRPSTVRLIVAEAEFYESDTAQHRDTVVYYQFLLSTDSTEKGKQFVKNEYKKALRKYNHQIKHTTQSFGEDNGEATLCFLNPFAVSPLTVAWAHDQASRSYIFSMILRMKVRQNRAGMVYLPHEPIGQDNRALLPDRL